MSDLDNYWLRKSRISRRRLLGSSAAAGIGLGALGLVGCGDDDDDDDAEPTSPPSGGTTAASPSAGASPTTAAKQKGGTAHFISANNTYDTFDVDRSRFSPVAWLMGYTNLGVTQWQSFTNSKLEGGIAETWEQPDKNTTTFKIRQNVYWHNKPPVNGRQAVADDVVQFILRNKNGKTSDGVDDPNFYRKAAYQNVDKVEAVDKFTAKVTFSKPDPFFLTTLAGSYSKVQAPEAIKAFEKDYANMKADLVIGTGAFVLKDWSAEGKSSWVRHDKFHEQVNLDGINWLPLFTDQSAQEAAFRQKQIDIFAPTQNAVIEALNKELQGKITETKVFSGNPQAGTYYGGAAPWNNPNLIGAIFRAFDRRSLVNSLLQGKAALAGNIPPTQSAFGITEKELITFPGYLEDRAKEEAEAKKMWDANGGPGLGEIIVDIPDIWEGLYSGGSGADHQPAEEGPRQHLHGEDRALFHHHRKARQAGVRQREEQHLVRLDHGNLRPGADAPQLPPVELLTATVPTVRREDRQSRYAHGAEHGRVRHRQASGNGQGSRARAIEGLRRRRSLLPGGCQLQHGLELREAGRGGAVRHHAPDR
ncbi:ABC transporter substrate-binding protein [Candidatus Amarobacter glycogenicus]|uniref:ABC transporter substrate-binding protein n=1 Tax=Candidatus Amarobacter glycogenicus TaxID=3140699 RepID=UPI0031349F30|nr:ABC transporter substrate-binding protein [Dehalococcoidia bacterium]